MLSQAPGKLFFPPRGGDFDATKLFDRDIVPIQPALWQNACLNFWAQGLGDFPKAYPPLFFTKKIRISNCDSDLESFLPQDPSKPPLFGVLDFATYLFVAKQLALPGRNIIPPAGYGYGHGRQKTEVPI